MDFRYRIAADVRLNRPWDTQLPGALLWIAAMNPRTTIPCPRCGKEVPWEGNPDRPFCSARCRLIDLAAWADGKYRVPGEKLPDEEPKE